MLGTCFPSVFSQLRAWASSLERKVTCLVTCTWEEIPKMELDPLMKGGAFRRKGAHPYASTRPHTTLTLHLTPPHTHSTPLHLTSLHSTPPHLTPSPLYSMRHSLITCTTPSCTSTSSLGIITRNVINRRRPVSF
jgi:hypothetical protein